MEIKVRRNKKGIRAKAIWYTYITQTSHNSAGGLDKYAICTYNILCVVCTVCEFVNGILGLGIIYFASNFSEFWIIWSTI